MYQSIHGVRSSSPYTGDASRCFPEFRRAHALLQWDGRRSKSPLAFSFKTRFLSSFQNKLFTLASFMMAKISDTLVASVTHLISDTALSEKFKVVSRSLLPISQFDLSPDIFRELEIGGYQW